jgi:hypothetical protein
MFGGLQDAVLFQYREMLNEFRGLKQQLENLGWRHNRLPKQPETLSCNNPSTWNPGTEPPLASPTHAQTTVTLDMLIKQYEELRLQLIADGKHLRQRLSSDSTVHSAALRRERMQATGEIVRVALNLHEDPHLGPVQDPQIRAAMKIWQLRVSLLSGLRQKSTGE